MKSFFSRFAVSFALLFLWAGYMLYFDYFSLLKKHLPVSLTMAFGSFVAGATAEGGGAVAFPVFTKALNIPSGTARDFALAIQSVGMTCGSLIIVRSGYAYLQNVFGWSLLGSAIGVILGLEFLAPIVVPPYPKIFFTLFTLCFGGFLVWLNSFQRKIRLSITTEGNARKLEFVVTGFFGGLISSLIGSGADVALFIVLCLRYNLDEKIGTRTTVFLMASTSMISFLYLTVSGRLSEGVLPMWLCAVPIVAFGAPFGAIFCTYQKREHVVAFLVGLIILEFATTLWLVPFDFTAKFFSGIFILTSSLFMVFLRYYSLPDGES